MKVLLVSYDLRQPSREYSKLYEILKNSPKWWHYLESTWLILTNDTPKQLFDKLNAALDSDDHILILEITKRNYWGVLAKDAWQWIEENVPYS